VEDKDEKDAVVVVEEGVFGLLCGVSGALPPLLGLALLLLLPLWLMAVDTTLEAVEVVVGTDIWGIAITSGAGNVDDEDVVEMRCDATAGKFNARILPPPCVSFEPSKLAGA
jgi:hypothetical protein